MATFTVRTRFVKPTDTQGPRIRVEIVGAGGKGRKARTLAPAARWGEDVKLFSPRARPTAPSARPRTRTHARTRAHARTDARNFPTATESWRADLRYCP